MNTCKTCKWHDADGFCTCNKLREQNDYELPDEVLKVENDALIYTYHEGGGFWTGPDFGCIHHTDK